jgi:hypothetical protein
LPFSLSPLYMWVLDCSEGKSGMSFAVLLAVESVHLPHCHSHPLHQRQWAKFTCWTGDSRLFGGTIEIVTAMAPIQNLNLSDCLTRSFHHYQYQQSFHILCWARSNTASSLVDSFYTNTHRTMKCCLGRNNLYATQCFEFKRSLRNVRNEKQSGALNGALENNIIAVICLFIAACSTLSFRRYTLHTKHSNTSQSNRAGKISCMVVITSLLAVGTHSFI